MSERKDVGDPLADFHRELPILVEASDQLITLILERRERKMMDLNLALGTLPTDRKNLMQQAIWRVLEMTARQGVLPLIVEIDRFGHQVERSEN